MAQRKKIGKIIVIDGLDGSGKATQAKFLIKNLKKAGYQTAVTDFPQYYSSFFGKMVGRYLSGEFGTVKQVDPYLASILFAADRWQAKDKMETWLRQGKIIVSNRYVSANQIHQTAKIKGKKEKEKFLKWLQEMEFKVFGIPRPDLIVYLNVPYNVSQKLIIKKGTRGYIGGIKRDIHESSKSHLTAAQRQIFQLIRRFNNWQQVECMKNNNLLTKREISNLVWAVVGKEI